MSLDDMHYREYPKIGNCPTLPACIILHMDRRKKGSFLFWGFPCTVLSRDKNAVHVIADIFLEMRTSVDLPVWISNAHIS